jgi:hypothetical protein
VHVQVYGERHSGEYAESNSNIEEDGALAESAGARGAKGVAKVGLGVAQVSGDPVAEAAGNPASGGSAPPDAGGSALAESARTDPVTFGSKTSSNPL